MKRKRQATSDAQRRDHLHESHAVQFRSQASARSSCGGTVRVGNRTSFFSDCLISGAVTIGNDCLFANNVTVLSGTHQIRGVGTIRENDAAWKRSPDFRLYDPISIGEDCWLGANSVILPGVSLGKGVVVGANTVVTKSFSDYVILGGVPAKVIGSRLSE